MCRRRRTDFWHRARDCSIDLLTFRPMELFWWLFTIVVFAVGLIGTVLPIFPGTTIILAAAVIHRMMLGPEKSISWNSIALLVLLALASYAFDFLGSYFGARYFGATRWAAFGAVVGAVVGICFGIMVLFVGPVICAVPGQLISGKR